MLTTKLLMTVVVFCGNHDSETRLSIDELRAVVSRVESIYEQVISLPILRDAEVQPESVEQQEQIVEAAAEVDQLISVELVETTDDQPIQNSAPMPMIEDVEFDAAVITEADESIAVDLTGSEATTTEVEQTEASATDITAAEASAVPSTELESAVEEDIEVSSMDVDLAGIQQAWPALDQHTRDAILMLVRADQLTQIQK